MPPPTVPLIYLLYTSHDRKYQGLHVLTTQCVSLLPYRNDFLSYYADFKRLWAKFSSWQSAQQGEVHVLESNSD